MKDKGHFYISLVKSGIRIAAGVTAAAMVARPIKKGIVSLAFPRAVAVLGVGFAVAELLGVAEELADKR